MTQDARFEDGAERSLNLGAVDADDLRILSALCQDAVLPAGEMRYLTDERRFALLLNRFRWEDEGAKTGRHAPERVRSVLVFDNVTGAARSGLETDKDTVLSLLAIEWLPADAPAGQVLLTFAGDGALRLDAEALEARLKDVTRPYRAVSGQMPGHG